MIPLPGFDDMAIDSGYPLAPRPNRCIIRIIMPPVSAMRLRRIEVDIFIQVTLAGNIIINSNDVRRTWIRAKKEELISRNTRPCKIIPKRMFRSDVAAQEIPRGPAPLILERSLVV